ncbi:hypothetical protein FACS1894190_12110 [Spirochaetia bacterium]|nr:hypothetical protein FACS1894190_12110 [Spirochaetia bacterium]
MKFKESKYVNPQELTEFSNQLSTAISNLQQKTLSVKASIHFPGKTGLELWPLAHHTTHGHYYCYTPIGKNPIEFWMGLDFSEGHVALIVWFDIINNSIIVPSLLATLFPTPTARFYDDFSRYHVPPVNQFWIPLRENDFTTFEKMNNTVAASKVIEDFLNEVLKVL